MPSCASTPVTRSINQLAEGHPHRWSQKGILLTKSCKFLITSPGSPSARDILILFRSIQRSQDYALVYCRSRRPSLCSSCSLSFRCTIVHDGAVEKWLGSPRVLRSSEAGDPSFAIGCLFNDSTSTLPYKEVGKSLGPLQNVSIIPNIRQ